MNEQSNQVHWNPAPAMETAPSLYTAFFFFLIPISYFPFLQCIFVFLMWWHNNAQCKWWNHLLLLFPKLIFCGTLQPSRIQYYTTQWRNISLNHLCRTKMHRHKRFKDEQRAYVEWGFPCEGAWMEEIRKASPIETSSDECSGIVSSVA